VFIPNLSHKRSWYALQTSRIHHVLLSQFTATIHYAPPSRPPSSPQWPLALSTYAADLFIGDLSVKLQHNIYQWLDVHTMQHANYVTMTSAELFTYWFWTKLQQQHKHKKQLYHRIIRRKFLCKKNPHMLITDLAATITKCLAKCLHTHRLFTTTLCYLPTQHHGNW